MPRVLNNDTYVPKADKKLQYKPSKIYPLRPLQLTISLISVCAKLRLEITCCQIAYSVYSDIYQSVMFCSGEILKITYFYNLNAGRWSVRNTQ